MRVDTRPRKRNSPRPAEKSAPAFLQWLRGRECFFVGKGPCDGKIEAMHLDFAGGKGMGTKVADRHALPGCSAHHGRQHLKGWNTFCKAVGLHQSTLLTAAANYWLAWPGRRAWEIKNAE